MKNLVKLSAFCAICLGMIVIAACSGKGKSNDGKVEVTGTVSGNTTATVVVTGSGTTTSTAATTAATTATSTTVSTSTATAAQ